MRTALLFSSSTNATFLNWHCHKCSQGILTRLLASDAYTLVPTWHWRDIPKQCWHNFSQVTLARSIPSDAVTIVPKWDWRDYSQVTLAPLSVNETVTIFPNCCQVKLARLFPSEINAIPLKWHWHDYFQGTLEELFLSDIISHVDNLLSTMMNCIIFVSDLQRWLACSHLKLARLLLSVFCFLVCSLEIVCLTNWYPTFCLTLYLAGAHFRAELQYVGDVGEQKIKYGPILSREINWY